MIITEEGMEKYIKIGIECESIEGKNPMWGVGRIITKLLKELSRRPELDKKFRFVLYFKDKIPDFNFLNSPIFIKKKLSVPFFKGKLFPVYYLILLPIKLWFERLNLMFWPAYMLPLGTFTKSLAIMTEDVYYESFKGSLPFKYRFFYMLFGTYSAKHSTKLLAISETSKNNIAKLYKINPDRISTVYLGVDLQKKMETKNTNQPYVLCVGQAFPRRHLKETMLAFEMISTEFPDLRFIAIGPDKYKKPTIKSLAVEINTRLGREAIIHKDYVGDGELAELYAGAKALLYVSDREAFGLPPMEALSFGVPPIIADNKLGHELFGDYAFYAKSGEVDDIVKAIKDVLTNSEKIEKIKHSGPDFVKQYSWKLFADRWLEIIKNETV
ncbi:MAG: glycosyltransferase family 1 protein [Candidatus Paceibacterota bacterium]